MPWAPFGSRRRRQARERAEEMRAHLEEHADQLVARGLTPEAARREALLRFGNPRAKLEEVEAMNRLAVFEPLWRDVRFAVRSLRHTPGFTAVVVAVLALGIGSATAIFSVVDAIVLRGLPFHESHRLMDVSATRLSDGSRPRSLAVPDVVDYRALQDVFDGLAATAILPRTALQEGGQSELMDGWRFTADLFEVLGVRPQLGRPFGPEHEVNGNHNVTVISDGLWRRRFGADPSIVGRLIALDRGSVEVLGVMPSGFDYPAGRSVSGDLWMPLVMPAKEKARTGPIVPYLSLVGRLKRDVPLRQAQTRMEHITASLKAEHPGWFSDQGILVRPIRTAIAGGDAIRSWMLMLLAAVACVLMLTCANVANLFVARTTARSREGRIRAALGASRWQLAQGALAESLLVAITGTTLGVLVAYWAVDVLRAAVPTTVPLVSSATIDFRILAIAGGTSIILGALLGLVPALQLGRPNLAARLRSGERTQTPGGATRRVRAALLVVEVALAVVLLVGAGLFASSFIRVMNVDLGLDHRHVIRVHVRGGILDDVLKRLPNVPGVEAVGALDQNEPLGSGSARYSVRVPGHPTEFWDADALRPHWATPGFFDVMRVPLLKGRLFSDLDTNASEPVVILSAEAVRRYFADRDPLGTVIDMNGRQAMVVGVVGSVLIDGPEAGAAPQAYFPASQKDLTRLNPTVLIRTNGDPRRGNVIANIKAAIWSIAPTQTLSPTTLVERLGALVAPRRFNMVILSMFGVMGTIIAAIGIYGVMAFIVTQRTQEIGIRMALGAEAARVQRSVLWSASRLLLMGLAIGLATAAALARLLEGLLFQVQPHDLTVYAAVSGVLLAVGLAAAYLPARRASRVDPLIALRAE
jgi:predicted permease